MSLSPSPINSATEIGTLDALDFMETAFPFATWSVTEDRPNLHPVIRSLWDQVKCKFWYCGHPAANALFEAVYLMSLCPSFHTEAQPCAE